MLAASFALSDRLLLAGIGPAGSGKTTAMRLLASAVDAAGGGLSRWRPLLSPQACWAPALSGPRTPCTPGCAGVNSPSKTTGSGRSCGRGDSVLVDEAGMAGTRLLDRFLADAAAAGAVVRC